MCVVVGGVGGGGGGGGSDWTEREKMRREVILKILYARGFLIFFLPIPSGAPFPVC